MLNGKHRVKVRHYRSQKAIEGAAPARYLRGKGFVEGKIIRKGMPEEKGGYTEVFAAVEGQVITARALCRPDEGFCYKDGRVEAFRQLGEKLEPLGYLVTIRGDVCRWHRGA